MLRLPIPNSAPSITDREVEALTRCLREGRLAGIPENLRGAIEMLKSYTHGNEVLLTTSCTTAMELALSAFDLTAADEVIVPSYTFVSTANAVVQCGGTPVFVDIEEESLNMDLHQVTSMIGSHTRGIMPVHYAGISCDMRLLLGLAEKHHLFVVEDAAHALGAKYNGKFLGTLGDFGCFSFHDTKNAVCGEGGAIVINNTMLRDRIFCHYEKGTDRSKFLLGEIDKYTWVSAGSSYVLSGVLAALLEIQLKRYGEMQRAREEHCRSYREGLASLKEEGIIRLPLIPTFSTSSHHIAFFLLRDSSHRDPLLSFLKGKGISAVSHYIPLHLSPYAREHFGTKQGQFPVTERIAESMVRLPLFPHLDAEERDYVIEQVLRFFHPKSTHSKRAHERTELVKEKKGDAPDLSLILSCYNEEGIIQKGVSEILSVLDHSALRYEIILIDDGSKDRTPECMREIATRYPHHAFRMEFHEKNQGRGATITEGIRIAWGRYVGFIDIDLEVHARYISALLLPLQQGEADVVIAHRNYKLYFFALKRHFMSLGYRWLVRFLLHTPPMDTEAGYKFFRRETILPILMRVKDPRWFWDTEICVRAYDAGLAICHIPVLFVRDRKKVSTFKDVRDSVRSIVALWKFRQGR
ncbi:MAG TPA: dTDP-4-amino-4,6-dideoxygalactose transaminase [Candidatus Peribacterales bacterium]|nr:dTDP-4-amino-4,6-dideoxygalactose transaminase [Candidatus Peribacterales bacterium]